MSAPSYSSSDFAAALQALMPSGRAWPTDSDATQAQALGALAPTFARQTARSNQLLVDAFPATSYELLSDWETTLGLPDSILGESPTIQGRRSQVVSRLASSGGQSAAYYTTVAANLGYTISITHFSPFRMGQSRMGSQLGGPEWAHTWAVNAPLNTLTPFRMGQSAMGEPLNAWGNSVLQRVISLIAPAHTLLQFYYS
jgi:uncharacterized protein YmfQ (DUF2313 family)